MTSDRDAYQIGEFCRRHGFSRSHYYDLPTEDRPREMRVGHRVLISVEDAAEWRARMARKSEAA